MSIGAANDEDAMTSNRRVYRFGESQLALEFGDITTSLSQVLVSSDDHYLTMRGGVSVAILQAGGRAIALDAAKKTPVRLGDVVVTTAGSLKAQYIFHAVTIGPDARSVSAEAVITQTTRRCLELLDVLHLDSIAFPAIGAGTAGFSLEEVALHMTAVIADHLTTHPRPIDVTIFLFNRSEEMSPLDFIRFFEEVRARMPDVARREVLGAAVGSPPPKVEPPREEARPAPTALRRTDILQRIDALGHERDRLESDLVDARAAADASRAEECSRRLRENETKRFACLTALKALPQGTIEVFISYSHRDEELRRELDTQLGVLRRQGLINAWHDRKIAAGSDWAREIDTRLVGAQVILLLISPNFCDSDYCRDIEVRQAIAREREGEARVIPIILRPANWTKEPFAHLQALPADAKPITTWANRDEAWLNVAQGIQSVVEQLVAKSPFGSS
jgi:O-acetyl-ADP-ribose deacetylase (regulator of RNase III)